jgi:hypothetical protein
MKMMWTFLVIACMAIVGVLVYMVVDSAISLTYARAHSQRLSHNCEVLAELANEGLRGRSVDAVVKSVGRTVTIKPEGSELRLDDVVLHVENGRILGVDKPDTCR